MKQIFLFILLLPICFAFNASTEPNTELKVFKIDGRKKDLKTLFYWGFNRTIEPDKVVIQFRNSLSSMVFLLNGEIAGGYSIDHQDGLVVNHSLQNPRLSMQDITRRQYRLDVVFKDDNEVLITITNTKMSYHKLSKQIVIHATLIEGNLKEQIEKASKQGKK